MCPDCKVGVRVLLRFKEERVEKSCLVDEEDALRSVRGDNSAAEIEEVAIVVTQTSLYLFSSLPPALVL